MITKMVISIVAACFGCILMVNGLVGIGYTGLSKTDPILYLSAGFMLTMISAQMARKVGLVTKMREEVASGTRVIHEASVSIVAIVVAVYSLSNAFFIGPTSNTGILYFSFGFALILIGFRHLRKTGWFQKLQDEAKEV